MKKFKLKTKTRNILLIVLGCVLILGAILGLVAMFHNDDKTTKTVSPSFAVGGLNSVGAYSSTKESIYTKDAFECQGLKITPDFTSTVKYQVYFYNSNDKFVKSSNLMSGKFEEDLTFGIVKCRIVITPNNDTNIKWYEVSKYAKQLKIEVNKEQGNKVSADLFEFEHSGSLTETYGTYGESDWQSSSKGVDVSCCSKVLIKGEDFSSTNYSIYNATGTRIADVTIPTENVKVGSDGIKYFEIDMSNYASATILQLCYKVGATFELRLCA